MANEKRFFTGIIDFNPKRMSDDEAEALGIPQHLRDFLADHRQYALNLSRLLPKNVAWFDPEQPWFFRFVMANESRVNRLLESDALILSGSGMSAHKIFHKEGNISTEDRTHLERSEKLVRDFLGQGKWILGICFGGQLGLHAVGAEIGRLPTLSNGHTATEAGWLDHHLTADVKNDDVFRFLSEQGDTFSAPHLHNDYVAKLPPVGTQVQTASGVITVVESKVLAFRNGFLGVNGVENKETEYIHASVVIFDNGAKIYQIQPHPEMASVAKANFLVRQNSWVAGEMGDAYYQQTLQVPENSDFSVSGVVTSFANEAKRYLEGKHKQTFADSVVVNNLSDYLIQ